MNNAENFVQTVLGLLPADRLGHCQCHEHLFISRGKSADIHSALWIDDPEKTIAELLAYKAQGGNSVVDAQPLGCGRMADQLVQASKQTGVHIIASTGFHKLVYYVDEHWIHSLDEDELTALFVDEYANGMYIDADRDTPRVQIEAKPGIIKTAVDENGIDDQYRKLFEAAAHASLLTGMPIQCHIEKGADPLKVFRFFHDFGIPADAIILCHLDRTHHDVGLHTELAQTGVYLEYDTIGRYKYHNDEVEAQLIKAMVDRGFSRSLLISLDTTRERLNSYGGKIGLTYILQTFIPLLVRIGIERNQIEEMTVHNAKRALAIRNGKEKERRP